MNATTKTTRISIPLRHSLLVRVGTLVTGAVLLVGIVFFQFGMDPLVQRIAEGQFAEAATRVESSLDSVFQPAHHVLNMSRQWVGDVPPSLDTPAPFNRVFMPILDALPQATSVVAGTSAGEGWMLMQRAEGGWRNRMTDLAPLGKHAPVRRTRRGR